MAERTVETGADSRSIVSLRSAQEKPDAQRVPAQQGDLLAGFLNRAPGASTAGSHASALNRATGFAPSRGAGALLELQRKHGNRHVQRVLSLARQAGGESEVGPEVEAVIEGERGRGAQLDQGVQGQMESAFGSEFGGVRVHTGTEAHALNRAVGAVAFTTGNDIFFSQGSYSPGSSGGRELLAHELTHVVQQGGAAPLSGRAQPALVQRMCAGCEEEKKGTRIQGKLVVGEANDPYEQEAERVSKAVTTTLDSHTAQGERSGLLQHKCACGGATSRDECSECRRTRLSREAATEAAETRSLKEKPRRALEAMAPEGFESLNRLQASFEEGLENPRSYVSEPESTRNPTGMGGGEDTTVDGDGDGGVPAVGDGATPMSGNPGAPAASNCSVSSGPTYSPSGTIPVTSSAGMKSASFSMAASFATDAATGKKPSCCEVHQFIKWDSAYASSHGGPPHSGFPSGAGADTWIEDRDSAGNRYGHRSDSFSDPIGGCGDEYKSGPTRDQANGDTYCGSDNPGTSSTGQWQFRLDAVDTCNANTVKASSPVITINW
jgi:hypothetical protein